jgi:hypothetical protein
MNSEIAEMRVRLSVYKEKKFRLIKEWEGLAASVRRGINPELNDVAVVKMDELDIVWDQMKLIWAKVSSLCISIERLERKLN